jgi:hypothetical protein
LEKTLHDLASAPCLAVAVIYSCKTVSVKSFY